MPLQSFADSTQHNKDRFLYFVVAPLGLRATNVRENSTVSLFSSVLLGDCHIPARRKRGGATWVDEVLTAARNISIISVVALLTVAAAAVFWLSSQSVFHDVLRHCWLAGGMNWSWVTFLRRRQRRPTNEFQTSPSRVSSLSSSSSTWFLTGVKNR